jgi:hypothetical protein
MNMKENKPLGRKEDIVVQEMNGEVLIYNLKDNKAFCLNETSALVWQLCDGNKSVSEISQAVGKKLNAPVSEDLVWLALDQLKNEKLLANNEEIVPAFNGVSRREVIKKIGLTSVVALPFVSSLIAPTASQAASPAGATPTATPTASPTAQGACNTTAAFFTAFGGACPQGCEGQPCNEGRSVCAADGTCGGTTASPTP